MKTQSVALAAALLCVHSVAFADMSTGVRMGTQGLGIDVTTPIVDHVLNVRFNGNYLSYNRNYSSSNTNYDGTLKLQTLGALADYHPFNGGFRLSGGLYYNGNRFNLNATPNGNSTYTVNGNTYTSSQVGSLNGQIEWNKAAPYLGLGWGNPVGKNSGLTFMTDLGVMYQGAAKVRLQATGAFSDPALANDVEQARQQAENDASKYRWYPVLSLGLAYKF